MSIALRFENDRNKRLTKRLPADYRPVMLLHGTSPSCGCAEAVAWSGLDAVGPFVEVAVHLAVERRRRKPAELTRVC